VLLSPEKEEEDEEEGLSNSFSCEEAKGLKEGVKKEAKGFSKKAGDGLVTVVVVGNEEEVDDEESQFEAKGLTKGLPVELAVEEANGLVEVLNKEEEGKVGSAVNPVVDVDKGVKGFANSLVVDVDDEESLLETNGFAKSLTASDEEEELLD
jgi:hypothetical protein